MVNTHTTAIRLLFAALIAVPTTAFTATSAVKTTKPMLPAPVASLQAAAQKDTSAYAIARSLTTEVGPRLAGSSGDTAAVAWALTELKSLGFADVHAESVTVPQWIRGHADVEITAPDPHRLAAAALVGSVGTSEDGVEAPVIAVADTAALENLNSDDVAGKIVYLSGRVRPSADGSGYRALASNVRDGAAIAAAKGAVAVVVRSLGTDSNRLPHTGWLRPVPLAARIPALAISNPDANLLDIELTKGVPVTLNITSTARELPPVRSANVVGEIPGRGKGQDEVVLLGAHLDSWDLGTGALDDAAGVATVLGAAHLIAALPARERPQRTWRVVLYANAEMGGSGAKAYAERHADELGQVILALAAPYGGVPVWRFDTGIAPAALGAAAPIAAALAPLGIQRGSDDFTGGRGTAPLFAHGVPIVRLLGDARVYYAIAATANDTLDKVNPIALKQNVAAYATVAYMAAASNRDFGRAPATLPAPQTTSPPTAATPSPPASTSSPR
jgi:hypothetical protein